MTLALGVSDTSGQWGHAVGFQFLVINSLGYPVILNTWVTRSFSLALSGKSVQIRSAQVSRVHCHCKELQGVVDHQYTSWVVSLCMSAVWGGICTSIVSAYHGYPVAGPAKSYHYYWSH